MSAAVCSVETRRASELSRPDDKRIVEHSTLIEVLKQSGNRLVDLPRERFMILHVAVLVPVLRRTVVDQFDESHSAFGQSPRDQALPAKALRVAAFHAVQLQCRFGLLSEVECFGGFDLHSVGCFERLNASSKIRIGTGSFQMFTIKSVGESQFQLLQAG